MGASTFGICGLTGDEADCMGEAGRRNKVDSGGELGALDFPFVDFVGEGEQIDFVGEGEQIDFVGDADRDFTIGSDI